MSKSVFKSWTFWINLLGSVGSVAGSGVVPPKYSIPILGAINIINRVVNTVGPVHIVSPDN
jgi:hypothetical protein